MEIKRWFGIFIFLYCSTFSLVDIGTDIGLAREYYLRGLQNESYLDCNKENLNTKNYQSSNQSMIKDGDYNQENVENRQIFFPLTAFWIIFGGLVQFIVAVKLFFNDEFEPLPTRLRLVVLIASMVLMAPVVVYFFGAALLIQNRENVNESVTK